MERSLIGDATRVIEVPCCGILLDPATLFVCPGCGRCPKCARRRIEWRELCEQCHLPYCPSCARCPGCGVQRFSEVRDPCECGYQPTDEIVQEFVAALGVSGKEPQTLWAKENREKSPFGWPMTILLIIVLFCGLLAILWLAVSGVFG